MEQGLQNLQREANLAVWTEQVRACRSSGLKVEEWCAQNGIKPNAYYRHQRKVFDAARAEEGRFYEVPANRTTGRIAASIRMNGLNVEIHSGADEETVLAVLRAVKTC